MHRLYCFLITVLVFYGAFFYLAGPDNPFCYAGAGLSKIVVNGKPISLKKIQEIRIRFQIPAKAVIPDGKYWYDRVSGLWGKEGGPALGQIVPHLDIGGALKADASKGHTGVFINGRQIHSQEYQFLQRLFGVVLPGRYWLNANGIGGYEGGPARFNIYSALVAAGRTSGKYSYTRRTPFGSVGGDGNCSYYMHPNGASVMNCD